MYKKYFITLASSSSYIAVSQSTANDIESFFSLKQNSVPWCHPAPASKFFDKSNTEALNSSIDIFTKLPKPYILLPAPSSPGSYKNPELIAKALLHKSLADIHLVMTGGSAAKHAESLKNNFPVIFRVSPKSR